MGEHEEKLERFREFIRKRGLKSTRQRDEIAGWFFDHKGHISADRIYREVKRESPGIGFSTVYRTMKLLCEAGLAHERHFSEGEALYENVSAHHDHFVCTECGRIIEFENPQIEALQEIAARELGFVIKSHKLEIYGFCEACARLPR